MTPEVHITEEKKLDKLDFRTLSSKFKNLKKKKKKKKTFVDQMIQSTE